MGGGNDDRGVAQWMTQMDLESLIGIFLNVQ
jgi:hypothetical protein